MITYRKIKVLWTHKWKMKKEVVWGDMRTCEQQSHKNERIDEEEK